MIWTELCKKRTTSERGGGFGFVHRFWMTHFLTLNTHNHTTFHSRGKGKKKQPESCKLNTQDLRGRAEITHNPASTTSESPQVKCLLLNAEIQPATATAAAGVLVENKTEKDTKGVEIRVVLWWWSAAAAAAAARLHFNTTAQWESGEQQSACPHTPPPQVCMCGFLGWVILSHVVDTSTSGCGDPISPHTAPAPLLTLPPLVQIPTHFLQQRHPPPLRLKTTAAAFGGNRWRFYQQQYDHRVTQN